MNSELSETLVRIEHKLDILLTEQKKEVPAIYKKLRAQGVACPVCGKQVVISTDPATQVTTRKCGCSPVRLKLQVENVLTPQMIKSIIRKELNAK